MENKELKDALLVFINLGEGIEDKLEDGKITFIEYMALVPKAFGIIQVIKNGEILADQIKNLTEDGREDLKQFVATELDLDNDKLEEIIEMVFVTILTLLEVLPLLRKKQ